MDAIRATVLFVMALLGHEQMTVTRDAIIREAHRQNVDPIIVLAVIQEESGFQWKARGPLGEVGLMQLSLETIARSGLTIKAAMFPAENIRLGTQKLAACLKRTRGDAERAIRCYNGGGSVDVAGERYTSKAHAWRVMRTYWKFKYLAEKAGIGEDQDEDDEKLGFKASFRGLRP